MLLAIDQGTTGTTCIVFDPEGTASRPRLPRVPPALPPPRLGRARRRRDLGRHARGRARGARRGRALTGAPCRHRHHQPARDRRRLGPGDRRAAAPRDRLAGPPHRRALRRAARSGHEPLVRARTGLVLDPYFSGTKIEWLLRHGDVPADACFGTIDAGWSTSSRAGTRPTLERLAHAAVRHRRAAPGRRAVRAARRAPGLAAGAAARALTSTARRASSAARCRWRGSPVTSRPRSTGRPAISPATARTPTAPAASCSRTPAPRCPSRRRGC